MTCFEEGLRDEVWDGLYRYKRPVRQIATEASQQRGKSPGKQGSKRNGKENTYKTFKRINR